MFYTLRTPYRQYIATFYDKVIQVIEVPFQHVVLALLMHQKKYLVSPVALVPLFQIDVSGSVHGYHDRENPLHFENKD